MNDRAAIDAAVAAWNERGPDAFLDFMAPDVEWHAPAGFPEGELFRGRDVLRPIMREQFGSVFNNSKMEPREVVKGPHGWLIGGRQTAEHEGTTVEWQGWYVVNIENGLVTQMWVYMDREPALRRAGIDE